MYGPSAYPCIFYVSSPSTVIMTYNYALFIQNRSDMLCAIKFVYRMKLCIWEFLAIFRCIRKVAKSDY